MANRSSLLPKVEVLIIIIFFIAFLVWAVSRCSATKREYQEAAQQEAAEALADSLSQTPPAAVPVPQASTPPPGTESAQVTKERNTTLYVTIDGLNMRLEPTLNASVVARLKLYEEVDFLNEVTDTTQQINLGQVLANEPWVKVRARGHVGWVYGAGVSYYKKKLEGVN